MFSCACHVSCTHDIIDDVASPQSKSSFVIDISPPILDLERRSKAQNIEKCSWISFWYIQLSLPVKKFVASSKWRPFWKMWNFRHSFKLTSDMKRSPPIMPNKYFSWWRRLRWRHGWPRSYPLYPCLGEVGSGSKLQRQCLVNRCEYRKHRLSM